VVHRVASDLRLGMMSFRYVGAKTECDAAAAVTDSKIEKYCPLNNMDGALLRTPLEVGDYVVDSDDPSYESGKRRHVDDLAEAINTTRGTSWTPLAEALYEAIGYYTQNINFCLNKNVAGECIDFPTADNPNGNYYFPTVTKSDPIQYWCQDNHILVITEGESTADINEQVKKLSGKVSEDDPHILSKDCPGTCTTHGQDSCLSGPLDKLKSGDGDDPDGNGVDDTDCDDGLYTSAYLDNMTWLGQHVQPLYKDRCVDDAAKESQTEKQAIYTHVVTTGTLLNEGTGECNPETLMEQAAVNGNTNDYYPGENPQQLEDNLYAVFDDILSRSSAGSAASVISSSRSGAGAVYQAVFWPKFEDGDPDGDGTSNKVSWVGDVHSLFVSSKGLMYDDWNQNGKLEPKEEGGNDNRILFYFSNTANKTRGCYDPEKIRTTGQCSEPAAKGDDLVPECSAENGCGPDSDDCKCVELQDIKYIWSVNKNLADKDVAKDRKLFTWNDLNNNGKVDADEWFQLNDQVDWTALDNEAAKADPPRGPVSNDFLKEDDVEDFVAYDAGSDMKSNALKTLTLWLQGVDVLPDAAGDVKVTDTDGNTWNAKELRSRKFTFKTTATVGGEEVAGYADKTWRLGDIIHSTPMVVAKPAELYHYIYRDPTYNSFAHKWSDRRNMIYFGGNDGMLHAVNGGYFYNNQFCCTPFDSDGACPSAPENGVCDGAPDLGEEMWAYIPYNLQPHLKCLADKFYAHKSYVDLKPRIFDVQIFQEDETHPGGWGTILVGGMHFGGAPAAAVDLNDTPNDNRKFISAYFVLDITDPDSEPKLLGEMTQTFKKDEDGNLITDSSGNYVDEYADMQYTTSSPSMIIMREGGANDVKSRWYLTLGSGPADLDGANNSGAHGKLAVIPLSWLNGDISGWTKGVPTGTSSNKKPFRIPAEKPKTGSQGGIFTVPAKDGASFISDIISVDYNIDLSSAGDDLGARYCTDAIYFGTVDGTDFEKYPSDYLDGAADQFYWNGGGRVFRLVTKIMTSKEDVNNNNMLDEGEDLNNNGELDTYVESASFPSEWAGKWDDGNPLRLLADVGMPVVGAQSVGYDGWNYWVYAGTGRFFGEKDKTDDGRCLDDDASCAATNKAKRSKAAMFGLKEPLMDKISGFDHWTAAHKPLSSSFTCDDQVMTWATIDWDINTDTNGDLAYTSSSDTPVPPAQPAGKRGLMRTDNILVEDTGSLYCYYCATDLADPSLYQCGKEDKLTGATLSDEDCFPGGTNGLIWNADEGRYTFDNLKWYIAGEAFNPTGKEQSGCIDNTGTGLDGWHHAFHDPRERNLGASALLGGLLTFTTYQPYNDKCQAEGQSYLYGIHFQTGTAWTETVFGTFEEDFDSGGDGGTKTIVKDKLSLGRGLSTTPSMHVGSDSDNDAKAFIQTSTGEIIEVEQKNLPIKAGRSGRQNWNDRLSE
jgi:type IV pilus assembly protein PilY1